MRDEDLIQTDGRKFGPNAMKLLLKFIARAAVPDGGGLNDVAKFLSDGAHRGRIMNEAMTNFDTAMTAVRAAPDNPHGDDEETIAAAILKQLEEAL